MTKYFDDKSIQNLEEVLSDLKHHGYSFCCPFDHLRNIPPSKKDCIDTCGSIIPDMIKHNSFRKMMCPCTMVKEDRFATTTDQLIRILTKVISDHRTEASKKKLMIVKIENWSVISLRNSPYEAPEVSGGCLYGEATGHRKFNPGTMIRTSRLVGKVLLRGDDRILIKTYSGSLYELGKISNDYESKFPGAALRLLDSLKRTAP